MNEMEPLDEYVKVYNIHVKNMYIYGVRKSNRNFIDIP